uniref:Uncharacterized protein n=1 Tax=Lotharella oceanica TaxID=641309 RepID=A0A140GYS4_9EUKA|nr:hypothetical protein AN617_54 [Lotharella oceanica]AMN87096.1 hypothetical protein AN617_54 [Lotharella oceanica]
MGLTLCTCTRKIVECWFWRENRPFYKNGAVNMLREYLLIFYKRASKEASALWAFFLSFFTSAKNFLGGLFNGLNDKETREHFTNRCGLFARRLAYVLPKFFTSQSVRVFLAFLGCLVKGVQSQAVEFCLSRWEGFLGFFYFCKYLWNESVSDRLLRRYTEDAATAFDGYSVGFFRGLFRLRSRYKSFRFVSGGGVCLSILFWLSGAFSGVLWKLYALLRRGLLSLCILWDNWIALGLPRQANIILTALGTGLCVFFCIKIVYWYAVLSCGWLDPFFWGFELLSHWYVHREYAEWHNLYSAYLFTLGLVLPLVTYFFCWYLGFWLLDFSSEGSVVRPYPFTDFELRLGVTFEELYVVTWAWFMNVLAISQGIWYNPADDVVAPYYKTPWCNRPFKIKKGADWWGSWFDYKGNEYHRLSNFFEYLEIIRLIRGPSAYTDGKSFINKQALKQVGMPLFREGDFFHYEPPWFHGLRDDWWLYEDMPGVWLFPGKRAPRLTFKQYDTFIGYYFDDFIHPENLEALEATDYWYRSYHELFVPEEQTYRILAYGVEYASMNQSYRDYGKRPEHLPEMWGPFGTLSGDLHRSTFIYRFRTSLVGWAQEFIQDYSRDIPLSSTVAAHRAFRRTCFHYGIALDYRDWTPLGFFKKVGLDANSWGSFWARFDQSATTRSLYDMEHDAFMFVWWVAPNIRRHTPLGYSRFDRMHRACAHETHIGQTFVLCPHNFVYDTVTTAQLLQ